MSGDECKITQVDLQENGIVRDKNGVIIGRLVEDVDALCDKYYARGFAAGQQGEKK